MDVVDSGSDSVGVGVGLEDVEELHVGLRSLDGDGVGIEPLDGGEDVCENKEEERKGQ